MLTKLLIKLTCVGVICIGGVAYMMSTQGKDPIATLRGQSLSVPKLSLPSMPDLPDMPKLNFMQAKAGKTSVYQWTDAQGGTQFSTSPPPPGTSYNTVEIDPNVNIVPAQRPPKQPVEITSKKSSEPSTKATPTYKDVGKIHKQIDQIKALNSNRADNLNALIEQQN